MPTEPSDQKRRDIARAVHMLRSALEPIDRAYAESRKRSVAMLDALDTWACSGGPLPTMPSANEDCWQFPLAFTIGDLVETVTDDDYPIAEWAALAATNASGCICELARAADNAVAAAGVGELVPEDEPDSADATADASPVRDGAALARRRRARRRGARAS